MRRLAARQQPGADLQTYDGTLPAILDAADAFSRGGAIHVPAEPAAITALPRPDERGLHGQVQGYGYSCMAGAPRVRRGREGVSGRGEDGVHAGPLSRAAIDRNSKKKDAAYEYIKFMASGKAQRAMAIEAGNMSVRGVLEPEYRKTNPGAPAVVKIRYLLPKDSRYPGRALP